MSLDSLEFSRILYILIRSFLAQKTFRFLNKNSNLNMLSRILSNFQKFTRILVQKNSINVCKASTVFKNLFSTLQAGIWNNRLLIKNQFRLSKKNVGSFMGVSTLALKYNFWFVHHASEVSYFHEKVMLHFSIIKTLKNYRRPT